MRYAGDAPQIPAAALSVPDAELLDRMVAMGQPVRLKLVMTETTTPGASAWNVSGEIPGSEKPDEVVVIGGHLDSWDPGEGAIDDGAGVAITTGAAKLIMGLPRHPRRTVRVVMFGAEEMDFSGPAYAEAHKDETARIVVTGESDVGADPIWSLQLPAGAVDAPALKPLASVLAPLKIFIANEPARFSGSDFAELSQAGVPAFAYRQDASRYFDWHHSADDTLDKVDPVAIRQNVAAWAALVYLIADSDIDFRALAAPPAPEHP
jgi:Zn-dependent M28 family amino/carboxypeptidase